MRGILLSLATVAVLAFVAPPVRATTIDTTDQINLGQSPLGSLHFVTLAVPPGDFALNLYNLSGKASGTGIFTSKAPYSIIENSGTSILGAPISSCTQTTTTCEFNLTQNQPVTFEYGKNGSLLKADMTFADLTETLITQGNVNDELAVNLTNFSGSMASDFSHDGVVQLVILFNIRVPLKYAGLIQNLDSFPAGKTIYASVQSGQVNPVIGADSIPEPASLGMLRAGLLGLGVFLRKKLHSGRHARAKYEQTFAAPDTVGR